jgi:hypothetical protein
MIPKETKLQGVLKMEHKPQQITNQYNILRKRKTKTKP